MGWDNDNDQFGTPLYDSPPTTWLLQNLLALIIAEQVRAFTWWNNRWAEKMNFTLLPINEANFHIGEPETFTAGCLYAIPKEEIKEQDNYDEKVIPVLLVLAAAPKQLAGTAAGKYSNVIINDFYNTAIMSIVQTAPDDKLTKGWPDGDDFAPGIKKFLKLAEPDKKLREAAGVQSVIRVDLFIQPNEITR